MRLLLTWSRRSPPSGRWWVRWTLSWRGWRPGTPTPPSSWPAGRCSRPAGPLAVISCLASGDLDVDRGADVGVQPDPDLVRAHGLDRVGHLDPAPVELRAARPAHRGGDVSRPDRAEQPAATAGPAAHQHVQALELARDGLGVLEAADFPGRPGSLDQLDLLLGAARPAHREAARDQVVAAVACRYVHDVTGCAETAHFLGEDELHRCTTHLPDS